MRPSDESNVDQDSEIDRGTVRRQNSKPSEYGSRLSTKPKSHHFHSSAKEHSNQRTNGVEGRSSIEQQVHAKGPSKPSYPHAFEVNEFNVREDLKSWEIAPDSWS